ncbi:hypothetical protein [Methylobacterium bullatum]|uniref:HNH nuclease domain-containing protein n=1 Tax=Methylobacterium bullatum TaxID=570505 RepID=A0AAV4Z6P7_9HYPH|nr:hypothetical protein [Methylobacterium bullatum]MBD8904693.1 hypothetical protein [Methylobacterium bullatum]GJD39477.1 hypothetical protein OICFNHDK_1938 [Methylobacterium bullatum]
MTAASEWRAERNERSRARLERALPAVFPAPVLQHALSRPLMPPTPRLAVESYWRNHVHRADRLARALATRSGQPEGWTWRLGTEKGSGLAATFRMPPSPYREPAHARGPGHCCICGQPVFRFGWHRDLWGTGTPNKNARWHSACVTAWKFWAAPSDQVKVLKAHQHHRCAASGKRLLKTAEIDHRTPLYRVWREHRDAPWPKLLAYWGAPNLQVVNRVVHVEKCSTEAGERAHQRRALVSGVSLDVESDGLMLLPTQA